VLAEATNTIAAGEVMQLMGSHDPEVDEARYLEVIRRKTAKLFEAAARLGGVLSRKSQFEEKLAQYGRHVGTAFQLIDDVLDYSGAAGEIGKNLGDDLAEGKPTLPLIHALRHADAGSATAIRHAVEKGGVENLDTVLAAIESTGGLAYTARLAKSESDSALAALAALPATPYREGLAALARFAIERKH